MLVRRFAVGVVLPVVLALCAMSSAAGAQPGRSSSAGTPIADPLIEQQKLTGDAIGDEFGNNVALSADGNTATIVGYGDLRVYTRSGNSWSRETALAFGGGEHRFTLSSDGNTALVGFDNNGAGSVSVLTRSATGWSVQDVLTAPASGSDAQIGNALFGSSVALSADGNTAFVGGAGDNNGVGAMWVYRRLANGPSVGWFEQQKLTAPTSGPDAEIAPPGMFGIFGSTVALSADGSTALIGGFQDSSNAGAVWVYSRSGGTWSEQQKLTAPTSGSDAEIGGGWFGESIALSSFGNTALIGGPQDQGNLPGTNGVGAAWLFTRSGTGWSEQRKLAAPSSGPDVELGNGAFGRDVSLSSDGSTAVIGGFGDNGYAGAVWVFMRSGSTWSEQKLIAPTSGPDAESPGGFGTSVAVSGDGKTALIGGGDSNGLGAVWVFAPVAKPQPPSSAPQSDAPPSSSGDGTWSVGIETTSSQVTPAQIKAQLLKQLVPSGKAVKFATLLKKGGYTFSFRTLGAGRVVINWYYLPKAARLSRATAKPLLVATGKASFSKAAAVKLTIKLTTNGKRMLTATRSLKLTTSGTYTPTGTSTVTATTTFTLKR